MTNVINEQAYLNMLQDILDNGVYRKPELEEGRLELFSQQLRFDLTNMKIPLFTTKKVFFKSLAAEMLWFLSGSQNIKELQENGVKIWDIWANEEGDVGALYGYQWRHWHVDNNPVIQELYGNKQELDQFAQVMESLRTCPEARSHLITAWRPDHLKAMSIKPCHILLQFYLVNGELSLTLYQRSCDAFLGVPFNIAQYSLLTHMVAHQLNVKAKEFIWIGGDVHIYENHVEQVKNQLKNEILEEPTLEFINKPKSLFEYKLTDFKVNDYVHADYIPAEVSPQGQPKKGKNLISSPYQFKVGDKVVKIGGDYSIEGIIDAAFVKRSGQVRYVVEADVPKGLLHIYSDTNLIKGS